MSKNYAPGPPSATRRFVVSRAIMGFASSAMNFALNVWIFRATGSYTTFALMVVAAELPTLLVSPLIGGLVDRIRRKNVLLGGDIILTSVAATTAILSFVGCLSIVFIGISVGLMAITRAIAASASSAFITSLVTPENRSTVNGYMHVSQGIIFIAAPFAGATSFGFWGLIGTAVICCVAYFIGLVMLFAVRINESLFIEKNLVLNDGQKSVLFRLRNEYTFGIKWIWSRSALRSLSLFFMTMNLGASIFIVAVTPYLLSFSTVAFRGFFASVVGVGLIVGGLLVRTWRRIKQQTFVIAVGGIVYGTAMLGVGLSRGEWTLLFLAFSWGVALPAMNATEEAIWQLAVPIEIQGRVNAARHIMDFGLKPFAVLLSIPFTVQVVSPLLSGSVGPLSLSDLWGSDVAAPLGLLLSFCGLVVLCALPLLLSAPKQGAIESPLVSSRG